MSLADGETISGKLVWKVDWPMRWAYEDVAFEPAGEDHHAPTGSFTVGRTLVREVFGGEAPHSAVYSFVTVAGAGGKMSGSTGAAAVPSAALRLLEPAIVRWLYIRRLPSQSFAIDLSPRAVQKLYDEWDRFVDAARQPDAGAADATMYRLATRSSSGTVASTQRPVSFRLLAAAADLTQGNREQIGRIVAQHLDEPVDSIDALLDELEPRLQCALNYVELLPAEQRTTVRERFDAATWEGLDDATAANVAALASEVGEAWTFDGADRARLRDPQAPARPAARRAAEPGAQSRAADVLQGALPAAVRERHGPAAADAHAVDRPRAHARAARRRARRRLTGLRAPPRASRSGA